MLSGEIGQRLKELIRFCECGALADRDLCSALLGLCVEPRIGTATLDAKLANAAFSIRHDLRGAPASRNAAGAAKQQVHRGRPSGRR